MPPRRKLAAILSADVEGYSRLMQDDEEATVAALVECREILARRIREYHGRVVDTPGDNLLAEFSSVVDAVQSAVRAQEELESRNTGVPESRKMRFRIGINLGDILEDGGRIYGDGVNVAARAEGLAEAGGVCLTGSAFDQVDGKLPLDFEDLGEHAVKNIAKPVRAYRLAAASPSPSMADQPAPTPRSPRLKRVAWLGVPALLVAALLATIWLTRGPEAPIPGRNQAGPADSSGPSIAVLPFANLSDDPEQEYFSDGITNDIITDLSRFRELLVIASNSVFTYRGKAADVRDVGRELGVRYVLEGSVQKIGNRLRLNAQLIDAATGHHLWAERYERGVEDLFTLQDEIVETIVATLAIQIREAEQNLAAGKETADLEAYDYLMRGWREYTRGSCGANAAAREFFGKALALDPDFSAAYAAMARTHEADFLHGCTEFPDQSLDRAFDLAQETLRMDPANATAHRVLGNAFMRRAHYDLAMVELEKALELNPNDALSYASLGSILLYSGHTAEALSLLEKVRRLNPAPTKGGHMNLALAYFLEARFEEAIDILKRGVIQHPDFAGNYIVLAAAYARTGRMPEASRAVAEALRRHPFFAVDDYGSAFQDPGDRKALVDALRLAGFE